MLKRVQVLYCKKCENYTKHDYVSREIVGVNDMGFARVFLGLLSLGVSEITTDTYWECEKCGEIRSR